MEEYQEHLETFFLWLNIVGVMKSQMMETAEAWMLACGEETDHLKVKNRPGGLVRLIAASSHATRISSSWSWPSGSHVLLHAEPQVWGEDEVHATAYGHSLGSLLRACRFESSPRSSLALYRNSVNYGSKGIN